MTCGDKMPPRKSWTELNFGAGKIFSLDKSTKHSHMHCAQTNKTVAIRVFNRPEFSGRHDFQAKKFGRQCTKSGSHAVSLHKKNQAKT